LLPYRCYRLARHHPMNSEETTPTDPGSLTTMYNEYMVELARIGTREFKLTPLRARKIAHEVLIASLASLPRITDMHAFLTASMRCASQHHRKNAKK